MESKSSFVYKNIRNDFRYSILDEKFKIGIGMSGISYEGVREIML